MISVLVGLLLLAFPVQCAEKFWAIAHMANNENVLGWALAAGANALETDITFDSTGVPITAFHGSPCDCTCLITYGTCQFPVSQICSEPHDISKVYAYFMAHPQREQVALLYVDSKIDAVPQRLERKAALNIVKLLEEEIFGKGYEGYVVIGGGKERYLKSLAEIVNLSQYQSKIFITYDGFSELSEGLQYMAKLDYNNKLLSAGISMCAQSFYNFEKDAVLGRINKAKGVISETIIWTIDREDQFDKYYNYGGRGFISNNIAVLVQWAKKRGYELFTKDDVVPSTTAGRESLVLNRGTCHCKAKGDGCVITKSAPEQSACKCTLTYGECAGKVVGCKDVSSAQCSAPDNSLESCFQGLGDCKGYSNNLHTCECAYKKDGCRVSKPAKYGKACRCTKDDANKSCEGEVVDCRQPESHYCTGSSSSDLTVSTSLQSCLQGGGDCGGYKDDQCKCKKRGTSGCVISSPAPKDTACSCTKKGSECKASVTICKDESLDTCKAPDTTLASCAQGSGNCNGYYEGCECYYVEEGCRVSKAAPPGSACKCYSYWSFGYGCYGEVVGCGNLTSDACKNPDTTVQSCHQGLGNCAGYEIV